jgi:DNA-binding response OmpR family regulator
MMMKWFLKPSGTICYRKGMRSRLPQMVCMPWKLHKQFYLLKIPVIIISSLQKKELMLSSIGLGADDFIQKPINFIELERRIKKHLG